MANWATARSLRALRPIQVPDLSGVVAVAADGGGVYAGSGGHIVALRSNGTVWAWGFNSAGQLGNDTATNSAIPVQAMGLNDVVAVAAGSVHTVALKRDGTVWTWGSNSRGQLGDGTSTGRRTPVPVNGLLNVRNGVVAIAAGEGHTVALQGDGTVWTWGLDNVGQLGDGTPGGTQFLPVQVPGLSGVITVAAGGNYTVALRDDGTVWAWGLNSSGELGDGTTTDRAAPVQVTGPGGIDFLSGIVAVAAGRDHTLALRNDGTVWAWGRSQYGGLGDGTNSGTRLTPVQVQGPGGAGVINLYESTVDTDGDGIADTS